MTTLSITAGPFTSRARLEAARAPKTCEAFSKLLPLSRRSSTCAGAASQPAQDIVFAGE